MKKLIFSFLLMIASQAIFAQYDWSQLNDKYAEVFKLAQLISDQTGKVTVSEDEMTHIGLERSSDVTVNFDRKLDNRETQGKFYKYYLGSSASDSRTLLDKEATEKVLDKYYTLLSTIKTRLDEEGDAKVDELLNSLLF